MTGVVVPPVTATPPPRGGRDMLRALRVRNFGLFLAGQLVSGTSAVTFSKPCRSFTGP